MTAAEGASHYPPETIRQHLDAARYGVLSTRAGEAIHSRFMVFACREDLERFFLLTDGSTDKVAELRANPHAALSVLTTADRLDDFAETVVRGHVAIVDDFASEAVQQGLPRLAAKAPMIDGLLQSGSLGSYVMLELAPDQLVFRIYRDIVRNEPKTVMSFADAG